MMNFRTGLSSRLVLLSFAFVVLLLSVFASTVNAQTFNVSTTAQLRTALENAAVNGQDDIIILAKGTYKTTDDGLGTFTFIDMQAHNLTIQAAAGLTADEVILDGANTHQVFNYNNTALSTLTLDRVSVVNGTASSGVGGVLVLHSNNLIVTDCIVSYNAASATGTIL